MDQNGFDDFLALANLGTSTFLANQTITSSRPSTYALNANGQMIVSGGGAPSPASALLSSSWTPWLIVIIALVMLFAFFHRK